MFTKRSTPWRCAASSTLWVPSTLVLKASSGDFSSMLTCLRAAAWKTTSGLWRANTASRRSASRMSASSMLSLPRSAVPPMVSSSACRADSSRSSITSSAGSAAAICRHSSEPMEPPAPVTSTVFPRRSSLMVLRSVSTGRRPRRSAGWISRRSVWWTPSIISFSGGTIFTGSSSSLATAVSVPMVSAEMWVVAMTRTSAPVRSRAGRSWSVVPATLTPAWRRWRLRRSSSRNPTGFQAEEGSRSIESASARPMSPAPTISAREGSASASRRTRRVRAASRRTR